MHKDYREIKWRIEFAFKQMIKLGVLSEPDYLCCNTCGHDDLGRLTQEVGARGWAFYHMQDEDDLRNRVECCVSYGGAADLCDPPPPESMYTLDVGNLLEEKLEKAGLETHWNGDIRQRINIKLPKRRKNSCSDIYFITDDEIWVLDDILDIEN